ncbi:MAG: hypothetical protein JSW28_03385 [Thermoplasmata archaeon]|nr:MAG: hypothetical protein JSW28_03385 [Thermoplasmata archaeon]
MIGKILLIIALLIACYIVIFGTILEDDWDYVALEQEKIRDGWLIKITASHRAWEEGDSGFSLHVFYHLTNETRGHIRDIDGRFNKNGTIIFFDIDDNNLLNKGDIFFIRGNSDSHIKPGYRFSLSVGIDSTIILK